MNQTYDLYVHPYPYDPDSENPQRMEGTLDPGRIVPFMVEVSNNANGPDMVNISIEGLDDKWSAWFGAVANTPDYTRNVRYTNFDEVMTVSNQGADINYLPNSSTVKKMTLILPTKQTAWVTVYVQAPDDALEDTKKTVSVKGESSGGTKDDRSDNKASLDLKVLYADLAIDGRIELTAGDSSIDDGDLTTISVNIRNVGDIEAVNVIVVLKVDGKEVKRAVVKRVLVDKSQLITFSWKADSGAERITVEIDPENTVKETNDQFNGINNNVKSRDVSIPWVPDLDGLGATTVLFPIFLLLLVIAAVGIATMVYLKKKQSQ